EAAVEGIVGAGDESGFVGTEEVGESGDFVRLAHAAHGLGLGELVVHFSFAAGIIFGEIVVHKGRVDSCRRNAVAANVVEDVVLGYGKSHGDHGALAGAVGEAVTETGSAGNGGDIEDDAPAA